MSDPLPTDHVARALDAASEADRDAKIEQLLLAGLDHYFSAEYEQAINIWTRALFLDRSHARARAYIERARSALAERLRESEELLQNGVAAFERGDGHEARRLLQTAMSRGAPSDEALAVLDRLDRLEQNATTQPQAAAVRTRPVPVVPRITARRASAALRILTWVTMLLAMAAAVGIAAISSYPEWRSLVRESTPAPAVLEPAAGEVGLPLPRRGEDLFERARALQASGHLREALATLELVRPTDPQKVEADRLRATMQKQLIALISADPSAPASDRNGDIRQP